MMFQNISCENPSDITLHRSMFFRLTFVKNHQEFELVAMVQIDIFLDDV